MIRGTCARCGLQRGQVRKIYELDYGDESTVAICNQCFGHYRRRGLSRELMATALRSRSWVRKA